MERVYLYSDYRLGRYPRTYPDETKAQLAGDREDWLRWLRDTGRNHRDNLVNNHRKESGEEGGEGVLGTTVLGDLHDLGNDPPNEVHPGHRRGEGETRDHGVEGLSLKLSRDEGDSVHSGIDNASHCVSFIL